jgi:hypothetical protein
MNNASKYLWMYIDILYWKMNQKETEEFWKELLSNEEWAKELLIRDIMSIRSIKSIMSITSP